MNGIADLTQVGNYVFKNCRIVSLFGCSLGAFFSLHAYRNKRFKNCLFQSPIVNMDYLIHQMFLWFHITEEQLKEKVEIQTSIDTMSWPYYVFVDTFNCQLTVAENSDKAIVESWLRNSLL